MNFFKDWVNRYKFFILFLFFLIAAIVLERRAEKYPYGKISAERIQSVLAQKEEKTDNKIIAIERSISELGMVEFIRENSVELNRFYLNNGISFIIYENDSLKYWSNNEIIISPLFSKSDFNQRLVHTPNSWHVIRSNEFANRVIIGLIKLNTDFAFENAFLTNEFHKSFDAGLNANINVEKIEGYEVFGKDGAYLFSVEKGSDKKIPYYNTLSAISYLMAIVFVLLFVLKWFRWLAIKISLDRNLLLIFVIIFLLVSRYLALYYSFPGLLANLSLFDPYHYAKSFWFPSLGDFFLNSFFLMFIAFLIYREFDYIGFQKIFKNKFVCIFATGFLISIYYLFFHYLLSGLVLNSNIFIEVHNFFYLNAYTLVGYLSIAFLIISLVLLIDKFIFIYSGFFSFWKFIGIISISIFLVFIPIMLVDSAVTIDQLFFMYVIVLSFSYFRIYKTRYTYPNRVLMVLLMAVFTLFFLTKLSVEKDKNIRRVMAVNLANERDQVAEFLLEEIEFNLQMDPVLLKMIQTPTYNDYEIYHYLVNNYFNRYFVKYEIQIATCGWNDELYLENSGQFVDCFNFFHFMIADHGLNIFPGSGFFYLDNQDGRISYLGVMLFNFTNSPFERKLFISLDSKLKIEQLGYPELLLEGRLGQAGAMANYSYARYYNGKLITRSGLYSYALEFNYTDLRAGNMVHQLSGGFNHLIYRVDNENIIIVSKQEIKPFDIITSFSYLFVFYFLFYSLLNLFANQGFRQNFYRYNFKNRIKFALIGVLLLSLLIVGVGTIFYNISQFEKKHYQNISEKIQSVLIKLEYKFFLEEEFNEELRGYITETLIKLSNVFYSDINMYDLNGNLYASSRPEVFELGLTGTQINPVAFKEMYINRSSKFIHRENIGKLSFVSAYVPFINADNEVLAYLNLPYFTKQNILKKEIYTLVVAVINIYTLLILLSFLVALFITNRITQPLKLIQDRLRRLSFGRNNEQLIYKGDDEIGSLVKEYNRMVSELGKSADLLAKSERESAWREMAKQIAHEIRNPLTPMKLSIQHLQKAWDDKLEHWNEVFERTSKTLVEQIDNLSKISSEFSNFAQMPSANNEKVDIIQKMKDVISLFETDKNIEITFDTNGMEKVFVFMDKIQLSRVFINLINNAIQSIPRNRHGLIHLDVSLSDNNVIVTISDNGQGISQEQRSKIFQPNFTTKTSGMGLGLAIVKNILENANGSIKYESVLNFGSSFIFTIPEYYAE